MGFTASIQRKTGPGFPLKRPVDKGTQPNASIIASDQGTDLATVTGDPRTQCSAYEPGGAPQIAAGNLADVGRGYMVLSFNHVFYDGGGGGAQAILTQTIMQDGASDNGRTYTGTVLGRRMECVKIDPDDKMGAWGNFVQFGLPLPDTVGSEDADFGTFLGNENASDCVGTGATLLVIPITDTLELFSQANPTAADHGGGGIIGNYFTDVYNVGHSGIISFSSTTDDLDISSTINSVVIPKSRRNEEWIVINTIGVEKRGNFPTGDSRVLRWFYEFEGEDFTNVRTNTTTGGSTKNGRGYSWSVSEGNFTHGRFSQMRVMTLPTNRPLTGGFTGNIWDASRNTVGVASEIDTQTLTLIRTEALNKFEWMEDRNAVVVSSDTWTASNFEVTIDCNGTDPIWLGFSTSVHQFAGQTRFRLTRDGTPIMSDGADWMSYGQMDQLTFIGGSNGVGDTDNDTLPLGLWWVDNPSAGLRTYRVEYRRNNGFTGANNAIFNSRDDGSSGFIGTLFAAEMSFPTRQPV
jgi:hypothetical protein